MDENKTRIKKDLFRRIRTLKGNSKNRGITFIALVITIVILIILAGVLISITIGNNGIIGKAISARQEYTNAQNNEIEEFNEDKIDEYVQGGKIYKITYNANGGSGTMNISKGLNSVIVAENKYTYPTTEKDFVVWNTKADGSGTNYNPGDSITHNETLYAKWGKINYNIGDTVTLGGETFYVIKDSDSTIPTLTLLSALNVKTSSGTGQYTQTSSTNPLRYDDNSNDYTSSEIKVQVDAYKAAVEGRMGEGKTVQEARLITKDEIISLGGNLGSHTVSGCTGTTAFVKATSYWVGSPVPSHSDQVYFVNSANNVFREYNVNYNEKFGLRPVLIVSKTML